MLTIFLQVERALGDLYWFMDIGFLGMTLISEALEHREKAMVECE